MKKTLSDLPKPIKLTTVCSKHGSVMTFGRYSNHPIFQDAHKEIGGRTYYCNECVDELIPEYELYMRTHN